MTRSATCSARDELGVLAEGLHLMQTAVQTRDQSIRRLAYEDALTRIDESGRIRVGLGRSTARGRRRADRSGSDQFASIRRINEHLGYSVGDAVLTEIAARIAAVPSVRSAVARLAADQFAAFTQTRRPRRPACLGNLAAFGARPSR